jgi:hypothetical protein
VEYPSNLLPSNAVLGYWIDQRILRATLDQSVSIMNQVVLNIQLKMAVIIIRPNMSNVSALSFENRHQAIL